MKQRRNIALIFVVLLLFVIITGCKKTEEIVADAKELVKDVVMLIKEEASEIEADLELKGKAALEVFHEGEKTIVYEFKEVESGALDEAKVIEGKIGDAESVFTDRLAQLKEKGVEGAKIVVKFVDKEGKEVYNKIFE